MSRFVKCTQYMSLNGTCDLDMASEDQPMWALLDEYDSINGTILVALRMPERTSRCAFTQHDTWEYVDDEDVPDYVWAVVAKRALLGELHAEEE